MNVIENINQKLTGKDWSLKEKERFLYLESCKAFSYDNRYFFLPFLTNENQKIIEGEMRNKTIDLEHVEDNVVVCSSHTYQVLYPLYQKFLNIPTAFHDNGHVFLELINSPYSIKADSTRGYDTARVKMNLDTMGYYLYLSGLENNLKNYLEKQFNKNLFQIDQRINYATAEGYLGNLQIEQFIAKAKLITIGIGMDELEQFVRLSFELLKDVLMSYHFSHFSDAEICLIKYLNELKEHIPISIKDIRLFQMHTLDKWNFANIYIAKTQDKNIYYVLNDKNNTINFYEISENDAKEYVNSFDGYSRHLLLHQN